jgi:hypothetical protein
LINDNIYSPVLFYNQKNKIFGLNICDNNKIYIFYNNKKQVLIIKNKYHNLVKKISPLTEPNILKKFIQYDFLPKIISSFQDCEYIY